MNLRSWRGLTILLLLASAFPPPRVMNALIVGYRQTESKEARKPLQARGRNRIGAPLQLDGSQAIGALSRGEPRTFRPSRLVATRPRSARLLIPSPPGPGGPTSRIPLRC